VILVQKVSKRYPLYRRPSDRLIESLPLSSKRHTEFWALREVSLSIPRGQFVAIVGPNGSGKSTLLQVVSGIIRPTSGRVVTEGRIGALLELGAGFNPEFTGRENVILNSEILGLGKKQIADALPDVEAFAEIGEFMDRPVKEYSSGMYVRLAFSAAIHIDPEILIIDEALAVGDAIFAGRCIRKFEELKHKGVTVLFVSHDLGLVKRLADRAVLMLHGSVEADGTPEEISNRYVGLVHEWEKLDRSKESSEPALASSYRHGDRASEILSVTLHDDQGIERQVFETGDQLTIRIRAEFFKDVDEPIAGMLIRNRLGMDVFGTNTRIEGKRLGVLQAGDILEIDFTVPCLLTAQEYSLTAATQHWDGRSQDWLDGVLKFTVTEKRAATGLASLPADVKWRVESGVGVK
jgi:ABC-type polysaccharide/polyol phosphate transport system ATPase subunit